MNLRFCAWASMPKDDPELTGFLGEEIFEEGLVFIGLGRERAVL